MIPSHPTIESDGTDFILAVPSDNGGGVYHLRFPITRAADMSRWLCERQLSAREHSRIGNVASPTQAMVNEWLKADDLRKKEEAEREVERMAGDLGLTQEELEGIVL